MKTFKQWCEQAGIDDLTQKVSQATQMALRLKKDPKPDVEKILDQESKKAMATNNSDHAAKVASAVSKIQPADPTKLKMKKK